jgi:hypothetical protein
VQRRLYQPHIWILGLGTCLASVFKTVIVDEDVAKSGISLRDEPLAAAPEVLRWSIRRIFTLSYSVPLGFLTIALPRDFVVSPKMYWSLPLRSDPRFEQIVASLAPKKP